MNDFRHRSSSGRNSKGMRRLGVLIIVGLFLLLSRVAPDLFEGGTPTATSSPPITDSQPSPSTGTAPEPGSTQLETGRQRIVDAFEKRQSKVWVEADGRVIKKLRDDNEGDRHQKFLIELDQQNRGKNLTLLVSHNIDLAPRVPLGQGDRVVFRGRYEWNDRGGVIHWTHHDPRGRGPGGWITHDGKTYR